MKKSLIRIMSLLIVATLLFASCKKNDPEPAPVIIPPTNITPTPNQPPTTAPSLNQGASTSINATAGINNSEWLNVSAQVTDPQGDAWTISSATSSNTNVATVEAVSKDGINSIKYVGVAPGTATFTLTVRDTNGNTNTITYTITITASPDAPSLNSNVNTALYVQAGSNTFWDLSDKVTDPQDDNWTITNVVSSNSSILTVGIDDATSIEYQGESAGTATMEVTLSDEDGNINTFSVTVNVTPKIIKVEANPK